MWFHLYEVPRVVRVMQTESRMVVAGAEGRREWELVLSGYRASDLQDKSWLHNNGKILNTT